MDCAYGIPAGPACPMTCFAVRLWRRRQMLLRLALANARISLGFGVDSLLGPHAMLTASETKSNLNFSTQQSDNFRSR